MKYLLIFTCLWSVNCFAVYDEIMESGRYRTAGGFDHCDKLEVTTTFNDKKLLSVHLVCLDQANFPGEFICEGKVCTQQGEKGGKIKILSKSKFHFIRNKVDSKYMRQGATFERGY